MAGRVKSVRVQPRAGTSNLECVLADDSGRLLLVFQGRRRIPGIQPGARLVVEGMVGDWARRQAILNPDYELIAGPEADVEPIDRRRHADSGPPARPPAPSLLMAPFCRYLLPPLPERRATARPGARPDGRGFAGGPSLQTSAIGRGANELSRFRPMTTQYTEGSLTDDPPPG